MKIHEASNMLGITPETIRFYEKEGMIKINRRLDNNYRDLEEKDIFSLIYCIRHRKMMGLVKNISSSMQGVSSKIFLEQLHNSIMKIEEQLQSQYRLLNYLKDQEKRIQWDLWNVENFQIDIQPERIYAPFMKTKNGQMFFREDAKTYFPQWMQAMPYVEIVQTVNFDSQVISPQNEIQWSFMLSAAIAEDIQLTDPQIGRLYEQKCIKSVVFHEDWNYPSTDIFQSTLDYMHGRKMEAKGIATAYFFPCYADGTNKSRIAEICIGI